MVDAGKIARAVMGNHVDALLNHMKLPMKNGCDLIVKDLSLSITRRWIRSCFHARPNGKTGWSGC